jgi:hypothetical protein
VAVYRAGAEEAAGLEEVLFETLPSGATAWTPELSRCMDPGASYVWFVRGVAEGVGDNEGWSKARYFAVSGQPSAAEVEEALDVLRRFSAHAGGNRVEPAASSLRTPPAAPFTTVARDGRKHITTTATASIKGEMLDPDGEAYGVIGISNSANGAGIGAGNTNNGPDLVLDGSEDGNDPDAVFTQAGIGRNSSEADTMFFLLNPDENHALNLHVEGSIQFATENSDGGLFYRDETTGDLHLQVNSPKLLIDIGGSTRVTIDDSGIISIDGTTVTVEGDTLNLTATTELNLDAPNIDLTAVADIDLEATNINATATAFMDIEGANTDLSGAAMTTITGALVKIN